MTQREAAELAGIKSSTYGNLESYDHRVVRRDKVERLLVGLNASAEQSAAVLAAYDAAPASPFAEKQRERWNRRNTERRARRESPALKRAIVRLLKDALIAERACECGGAEGDAACPLCEGLRVLGVAEGWTVVAGEHVDRLELELIVEAEKSTGSPQSVDSRSSEPEDAGGDFG